jgi:hypothetical protein
MINANPTLTLAIFVIIAPASTVFSTGLLAEKEYATKAYVDQRLSTVVCRMDRDKKFDLQSEVFDLSQKLNNDAGNIDLAREYERIKSLLVDVEYAIKVSKCVM